MIVVRSFVVNSPLMSLRTGGTIGATTTEIINPNNLKIEGFYCDDRFSNEERILLNQDIREISSKGLIVNDHEVLSEPEELIRLKKVLEIGFELIGKTVVTNNKTKVGKVEDYALDTKSLYVKKLYVTRSMFKSIGTGQLLVDRNDIIEVTDKKIVIKNILPPTKTRAALKTVMSGNN